MNADGFVRILSSARCHRGEELDAKQDNLTCKKCPLDTYQPDLHPIDQKCLDCDEDTGTRAEGATECEGKLIEKGSALT